MEYTIEDRVINVISSSQKILTGIVTPDKTLEELGIDSFDGINLLYALEEEFNVSLPDDARNYTSVQAIIEGMEFIIEDEQMPNQPTLPLITENMDL